MEKKELYTTPKIEIVRLCNTDIITTSNTNNGIGEDGGENDGEWMSDIPSF